MKQEARLEAVAIRNKKLLGWRPTLLGWMPNMKLLVAMHFST